MRLAMRTLIDVSLFVHARRAWHGKQYFTPATIVVAQADRSFVSLLPSFLILVEVSLPLSLSLARSLARSRLLLPLFLILYQTSFFLTYGFPRRRPSHRKQKLRTNTYRLVQPRVLVAYELVFAERANQSVGDFR